MSIRKLFALLLAVAVVFAPAFSGAGAAAAAAPDHHAQMVESGHCEAPSQSDDEDQTPAKSCCVSACMGIAVAPTARSTDTIVQPAPAAFGLSSLHLSYLGEIATPPPRLS